MHEHGLMTKLLRSAQAEAETRGGALREIRVRLGALSSSDPAHFRSDFEHVRDELGLGPIEVTIEPAPDHPAGVELLSIVVSERA